MLDSRVILKYLVVQLTGLAIVVAALILARRILSIPDWLTITILLLWIIKDVAMFFKVWRSYAVHDNSPLIQLLGLEATVIYDLDPVGYVRVRGELWKAEPDDQECPVKRGDITRVVDRKGMTLIVEPIGSGDTKYGLSA